MWDTPGCVPCPAAYHLVTPGKSLPGPCVEQQGTPLRAATQIKDDTLKWTLLTGVRGQPLEPQSVLYLVFPGHTFPSGVPALMSLQERADVHTSRACAGREGETELPTPSSSPDEHPCHNPTWQGKQHKVGWGQGGRDPRPTCSPTAPPPRLHPGRGFSARGSPGILPGAHHPHF